MLRAGDIKRLCSKTGIRPNKTLGQNFLIDKNIRDKILEAVQLSGDDIVLEIGPGFGALTGELCKRARKVIAVEKDKRLCEFLRRSDFSGLVDIVEGDILGIDIRAVHDRFKKKIKIVGNLPYYISSPVVVKTIESREFIASAHITVQKEFAERLSSPVGSRACGAISHYVKFYSEPGIVFRIKKSSFFPMPGIDSCFIELYIREGRLYLTDEEKLFKIIRTSFEKRRKTILNSLFLSGHFRSKDGLKKALLESGIEPDSRPETVCLESFVRLAEILDFKRS